MNIRSRASLPHSTAKNDRFTWCFAVGLGASSSSAAEACRGRAYAHGCSPIHEGWENAPSPTRTKVELPTEAVGATPWRAPRQSSCEDHHYRCERKASANESTGRVVRGINCSSHEVRVEASARVASGRWTCSQTHPPAFNKGKLMVVGQGRQGG